jgi:hypothetical protein
MTFGGGVRLPCVKVEVRDGDAVVATVTVEGGVPGLFLVDVVGRLHLAARRLGWTVALCDEEVRDLADLAGLSFEACGQAERREQRRVEEVVQPDEPPA